MTDRVQPERPRRVERELDSDDLLTIGPHELGAEQWRGDGVEFVAQPGVVEHPLDLVVHHDRSGQVVHLGRSLEHPDRESLSGEQQRHGHADRATAHHHHIDVARSLVAHRRDSGPRNIVTRASAWALMNESASVSWPSRRASGALT